jgi:hypothetical protein
MQSAILQSFSDVRVRVRVRRLLSSPSPKISDFENPSDSESARPGFFQQQKIVFFCKISFFKIFQKKAPKNSKKIYLIFDTIWLQFG